MTTIFKDKTVQALAANRYTLNQGLSIIAIDSSKTQHLRNTDTVEKLPIGFIYTVDESKYNELLPRPFNQSTVRSQIKDVKIIVPTCNPDESGERHMRSGLSDDEQYAWSKYFGTRILESDTSDALPFANTKDIKIYIDLDMKALFKDVDSKTPKAVKNLMSARNDDPKRPYPHFGTYIHDHLAYDASSPEDISGTAASYSGMNTSRKTALEYIFESIEVMVAESDIYRHYKNTPLFDTTKTDDQYSLELYMGQFRAKDEVKHLNDVYTDDFNKPTQLDTETFIQTAAMVKLCHSITDIRKKHLISLYLQEDASRMMDLIISPIPDWYIVSPTMPRLGLKPVII